MERNTLINEMQAHRTAESISDPVVRNLVKFGVAEARMRAIRRVGQDEDAWRSRLPEEPFDMEYFTQVLLSMFEKRDIVTAVLSGQDLAEASGWDV